MNDEESTPDLNRPVYLCGCDMGGWHTRKKDAIAVVKWTGEGRGVGHVVNHGRLFFPIRDNGLLIETIHSAIDQKARVVVAVDAALGWPVDFLSLAMRARRAIHVPEVNPDLSQIQNSCLFRETERFIRKFVRRNRDPLSGPGDSFGNCCSKAQSLVACLKRRFPEIYRPPFDNWSPERACGALLTVIEVYPAASMHSDEFRRLRWKDEEEAYADLEKSDENDAKRCATTAACYAMTLGIVSAEPGFPKLWTPNEADPRQYDPRKIQREGWIFAPRREGGE